MWIWRIRLSAVLVTALLIPGVLIPGMAGCRAAPVEPDIRSRDPESRIAGIIAAGQADDPAHLPLLIEALSDDDAAVRLFAAESLRRRTGRDFGYRAYDAPEPRQQAIHRWQQYLDGQLAESGPAAGPNNPR